MSPIRILREAAACVGRLVLPPRGRSGGWVVAGFLLYAVGATLAMLVVPLTSPPAWVIVGLVLATLQFFAQSRPIGRGRRVARWGALGVTLFTVASFAHFSFLAITIFGWAGPRWLVLLIEAAAALSVLTALPRSLPVRFPLVIPVGISVLLIPLSGPEDLSIRCDDQLAVVAQPGVNILIPTTKEQLQCKPGDQLSIGRYLRTIWEAPEGGRFVVTSQAESQVGWHTGKGRPVQSRFTGSFCEAWPGFGREPRCFGEGKADGIIDAEKVNRLFVTQWDFHHRDMPGTVWAVTRTSPMEVLQTRQFPLGTAGGFYTPDGDILGVGYDEGVGVDFMHGADMSDAGTSRLAFQGNFVRYDAPHKEGVLCSGLGPMIPIEGQAYMSIAYTGVPPFSRRLLGSSNRYPWAWAAIVWGCDWDPDARIVWYNITNLGVTLAMNYDTGRLIGGPIAFTPPGVRVVTWDKARRRLYMNTWASGEVLAVSLDTGKILKRWAAGRWARDTVLSRDGKYIYVTSNLGVVRINVDF